MIALLLLALVQPQVDDPDPRPRRSDRVGAHPRLLFWQPNLNGTMVADEGVAPSIDGSRVSLDGDLDIDDHDVFPVFELGFFETYHHGSHSAEIERLTLTFWSHQWEGSATLDQTETFNGSVYPAGTTVDSRFRVGLFGIDSLVFAAGIPESNIDGGFTIGLRVIDVKGTMDGAPADRSERTRLLYLGCGFRGEWHPAPFLYGAAWASVYFSYGDIADEILVDFETWGAVDLEGALSLGMEWGPMRAEIGFRFIANAFDIVRDDSSASEETDFSFFAGGPYLQFSIRF
jgi:hypothetical protein